MDNDALISIIIPVYNVKEYLKQCVNSVLSQTYNKLEVLLINDGSTDESGEMCEQLSKQDERIVVIHQENGGLSDARNTGTKTAKGKYIFYLDSDDYIAPTCIEKLYNALIKYNAEVAQANFYYDYPDYLLYQNYLKKDKVYSKVEAMEALLKQEEIKNFAWGKLIQVEIAKQYLFPKGKYFEDTYWKFKVINECSKYVALAEPMLYYLQRSTGISGAFSIRNLDQLEGEHNRIDFIKTHSNYAPLLELAKKQFRNKLLQHRNYLKNLNLEDKTRYLNEIRNYEKFYGWKYRPFIHKINHFYNKVCNRLKVSHMVKVYHKMS